MKDRLRALAGTLDPLGLLDEIRAFNITWPDWLRTGRFIRWRNATPTSTAFCGA